MWAYPRAPPLPSARAARFAMRTLWSVAGRGLPLGLISTADRRQQPPSAAARTAMITAACWAVLSSAQVFLNVTGLGSLEP